MYDEHVGELCAQAHRRKIALRVFRDGSGDLPLQLQGGVRLAWLHLWPHVRPWRVAQPQPMLRGLREPERVAAIMKDAIAADASPAKTAQVLALPPRVVRLPHDVPTSAAA